MKTSLLIRTFIIIMAIAASVSLPAATPVGGTFTVGDKTFLLNGKPFVVKAAELHYPRIPRQYWEHRIRMCRALGMNTICMYVFWNIHEQREGEFDFTGQNDIAEFCRLAQKKRHVRYRASRPLCLCRVGDGWPAVVAVEEEGHPPS